MRIPTHWVPRAAKNLVPGYRLRWRHSYAAFLSEIAQVVPTLKFGETDGIAWLDQIAGGPRLHGFWTEAADGELFDNLRPDLPRALPRPHFRLVRDYLTRYRYPHMRPDLKPAGFPPEKMMGFHGQHKEAIADFPDHSVRTALSEAFLPKEGEVIIDCGAFVGFGDIRVAADIGEGTVYAIEASPQCHALLALNVAHNNIKNIVPIHRGIWNEISTLELEAGYAQANSLVSEVHKGERTVEIPTITIDDIVASHDIPRVDMISLTLNGAEPEALAGAEKTLANHRPRIRLPGWYKRGGQPISEICTAILERYGYQVFVGPLDNTFGLPD
jgi:FkbM family methyltransferase